LIGLFIKESKTNEEKQPIPDSNFHIFIGTYSKYTKMVGDGSVWLQDLTGVYRQKVIKDSWS
jgi:hypothetical protein